MVRLGKLEQFKNTERLNKQ